MITRNKHTNLSGNRVIKTSMKILVVLSCALLPFLPNSLKAQVINIECADISVTNGTVVDGNTIENTLYSITNNGIINLSGNNIIYLNLFNYIVI